MPVQPARPRIITTDSTPRGNTAANAKISRMLGIAVITMVVNLATDVLYKLVDPRVVLK